MNLSKPKKILTVTAIALLIAVPLTTSLATKKSNTSVSSQAAASTITLNPTVKYQTITGWEATSQSGQVSSPKFPEYKDYLFDQAVNDLGITRIRLEVRPKADDSGWDFTEVDDNMNAIILPLKQKVESRGEKLWINMCYVNKRTAFLNPQAYSNQVLATYQHLQTTFGFTPDSWEQLEPDTFGWGNATTLGNAIAAAGAKLEQNGYTPYFVGPSLAKGNNTVSWINTIKTIPNAYKFVKEISYHRYDNPSPSTIAQIATLATQDNKATSMLEKINDGYPELHIDLKQGNNTAWQQYTIAFPLNDTGGQYYLVNNAATTPQTQITIASKTKFLRQYFKFIRPGAQRIDAQTSNATFDPIAFINKDGNYVVVVKASGSGSFDIGSLPAGTYGIKYTTAVQYDFDNPDQTITTSQNVATSIPAAGVITIYQKSAAVASAPNLAIVGDSGSDEYRADDNRAGGTQYATTTLNWDELLVKYRNFNFGPWSDTSRGEPRRKGFEYNYARSAQRVQDAINTNQHTAVRDLISSGKVQYVYIQIGANDVAEWNNTYQDIYNGVTAGTALTTKRNNMLSGYDTMMDTVKSGGNAKVVIATMPDLNLDPTVVARYPDAAKRQRITDFVNGVNAGLKTAAQSRSITVFDTLAFYQSDIIPKAGTDGFLTMASEKIDMRSVGNEPHHMVLGDSIHPGTAMGGVLANGILKTFNAAYGTTFQPFSDLEIVQHAGMTGSSISTTPNPTTVITPSPTTIIKKGDVDRNGAVNLLDYTLLFEAYGTKTGDATFDPRCDFVGSPSSGPDGKINILDYTVLFENYGT